MKYKMSKIKCKLVQQRRTFLISVIIIINFLVFINGQDEIQLNLIPGDHLHYTKNDMTEFSGDHNIVGERILKKEHSPFIVRNDILIERGAKLVIEPGVIVHFVPMIGITVRGTLTALGTPENKILLTTQKDSGYENQVFAGAQELGARLVDGPTPLEGRLQLFHQGSWRSVCTNSRNWTIEDYVTTCRQMGFQGGRFWNWMDRTPSFESRMLFEEPMCRGIENSLFECSWSTRQIGSGACDYHTDIGIQCLPLLEKASSHWRGIKFYNAPSERKLALDNTNYEATSFSKLKHVDVIRAGSGRGRTANGAIEIIGVPPILSHVTVDQSAYTGINVTKPESAFTFQEVTVKRSRGIGIFVNSSYGLAHLEGCTVTESGSDGIRYIGHDLRSDERTDRSNIHDFCTLPTTAGQTYPISISVQQSRFSATTKDCGKYFFTRNDYVLTVSFVHFVVMKNESAAIEIFDGASGNDRLLGTWLIRNSTRPQTLTSTQNKIYVKFHADPRSDVIGYLRITTGFNKGFDLNVTNGIIQDNSGRGVAIDNLRSQIHIHSSDISNNGHTAGLHVVNGAGDVNITNSKISFNRGDGINITYFGGNRNISGSSISSNKGYGLAVWLNETEKDREEFTQFNQTTTIEYSKIISNLETGIRHGNFCNDAWVNITGNWFNDSISNAVDIQTCWFSQENNHKLRLQIGHNVFENNNRISVIISPALNLDAKIEYNHFKYGKYGSLLIRNKLLEEFRTLPAIIHVQHNHFYWNKGVFVASLGLSPYSDRSTQWLLFTRNFVRDNRIKEPFGPADEGGEGQSGENRLNPRSRVAAPIVISSSNVDIFRNIIANPESKYEVGSQLSDQSEILNVTYNWLGFTDEEKIFARLFHRKDRYDLAKIEYLPYLIHNSNPGTTKIISIPTFVPHFFVEGSDRIGGEVDGQETLPSGSYIVERDINIRPGGKLILNPGVTLNFVPSVGLMVAGKLEARGKSPDDILLTLKREAVMVGDNDTMESLKMRDMELMDMDMDTEAVIDVDETPMTPVRLLGGDNEHEGRLQIYLDSKWGTVCDYGWTVRDAALACHQLGLALNPNDWRLQRNEVPGAGTSEEVILSNVRCTEHDIDITQCRAERLSKGDFENSCTHDSDVGIRCYPGAWAGLRFSVLADRADLQYLTVKNAGLFDYTTNTFKPALQMDFARHNMDNVRVVENLHDGFGVVYSDIFGGDGINNIKNSEFSDNRGNGVSIKQLGLKIHGSQIKNNKGAGINHDSVLSAMEQRELSGWFHMASDFNVQESEYKPVTLPKDSIENIDLDIYSMRHIITTRSTGESIERTIKIRCQPRYVIGIQLLNPIENRSSEEIWIHDSQNINMKSDVWQVTRDLSIFPMSSSSYGIVLRYKSGENSLGGTVLALSMVPAPVQDVRNKIIRGPVPTLQITSTKIQKNTRGFSATYYNRYLGEKGEHYLRKSNESIKIINCELSNNAQEAFFVHAPFWDVHVSNISEITIHINSSLIMNNGRGIHHFSKDLRSSNNLFHYLMQDTTVENNAFGGMQISLPYVWQYNENFTHTVFLGNGSWIRNRKFEISINGHYAAVNITGNSFINNECLNGLIGFKGMEKKLRIDNNRITGNNGKYMIEFKADSQSEILGELHAIFTLNDIKNNKFETQTMFKASYQLQKKYTREPTTVIGFGGVQKVRITRNLISDNKLDYDLLAGIKSARIKNYLDATHNWWGSIDPDHINSRIFDFDDWNNHAEVLFKPYLLEDSTDASVSVSTMERPPMDLNNLGGRIFENLSIWRRDVPYIVKSDITVMPGVTLTIGAGVELEFTPNVGILVLGNMIAKGARDGEIIMRSIKPKAAEINRIERSLENMVTHDSIRLCTNRNCSYDENEVERTHQGFLEYFNHTTLQWVPICDHRFTERNAQVVCRELGFDPLDVFFAHDRRIEFHTNSLTRIWSWVEPLECHGDEFRMEECPERLNGQLYGRRHECKWDSSFVFVSCNGEAEQKPYWGGLRFANADFEQNLYEHRIHDAKTHRSNKRQESELEFIRIDGAGILHGEKSPAIQSIFRTPSISLVTIENSAHHGVNLISPQDTIHMQYLTIKNVLGQGINAISLTGEGRESDESSFTPLRSLDLPYHLFSVIDICDTSKEIVIEERVIIYYKYDNNPVNCVKIFTSAYRVKPLGLRLLQSNLFNHSKEYGRRDVIQLYDGDIYNITAIPVGNIESDSENEKKLFKTKGPTLSVRLIASGAPAGHGFFAEVVTLPISAIGFNRDAQHNISGTEISGAVGGALSYLSVGEVSPILTLERNRFFNNCRQLYGNFSTCDSAIKIDVQNMQSLFFRNNLVRHNQGGLYIRADSRGSATSLRGWIHHNLFSKNLNRASLYVEGRQSSPYQEVIIYKNYFTQNDAAYDDVITLRQVVSNLTYNYIHSNKGGRIVEISGFDKVRLPIYQTTSHNGFYDNIATDWRGRATIVAGTAGQHYVDNIFRNPENDYEIITVNRSLFEFQYWNSTLDVWKSKIDATYNYWNYNETLAVGGRIRDRSDDSLLLEVQFIPFHMNNETILDGKCPPGWSLMLDTCYMYVGAPMTFYEARDFCRSDNASMPFIRGDTTVLREYLQKQMSHLRFTEKVWIQDLNSINECTTFIYSGVELTDCNTKNSFLCEIDPKVFIDPLSWQTDVLAISLISVLALGLLLLCCIGLCWYCKSRHRHTQRLQRRNSIRQSMRSLNSIDPQGSIRRRNLNMSRSTDTLTKSTATDYKKMISNGSIESIEKSALNSETSYDVYETSNPHVNEYLTPNQNYDNDILQDKYNQYANQKQARDAAQKPTTKVYGVPEFKPQGFELAYRNEGYRDNSYGGTRSNSINTQINEESPIIHQTDTEDTGSDYYGNSSTLPLRANGENLLFLSDLKHRLPEYEPLAKQSPGHSSFLPSPPPAPSELSNSSLPYDKKIDKLNFTPVEHNYHLPQIRRPDFYTPSSTPPEVKRPDSYYTAVRSSKAPENILPPPPPINRPKAVYESSGENRPSYSRSKSEALLETNFDYEDDLKTSPLKADSRCYSQPLETAM